MRRMPTRMLRFVGHSAVIQFWQRRTDLSVNEFLPFRPRSAIHPRFLVEGRPLVSRLTSLVVHRNRPRPGNRRIDRPPTNDDDDDDDDDSIPPGLGERERGREFLTINFNDFFSSPFLRDVESSARDSEVWICLDFLIALSV